MQCSTSAVVPPLDELLLQRFTGLTRSGNAQFSWFPATNGWNPDSIEAESTATPERRARCSRQIDNSLAEVHVSSLAYDGLARFKSIIQANHAALA